MKIITTNEIVKRFEIKHGDRYNYSLVKYKNMFTKVEIICDVHGVFKQSPLNHLRGGCRFCGGSSKLSLDDFVERSIKIHGNKYDYSLVDYKNNSTKVKIICDVHGVFEQIPNTHLLGSGCSKCGKTLTVDNFIERSNIQHKNRYDYSLVDYKNITTKVNIVCDEHGVFCQSPHKHIGGRGCPECANNSRSLKLSSNTKDFINRSIKIHGSKYDYSLVDYKNNCTKVKIICDIHGTFEQTPTGHLEGKGCSLCKSSKGENKISRYLIQNNIIFKPQKTFDDCYFINKLSYDFFIPKFNICIEFDGIQHFEPVEIFGGVEEFEKLKIRDNIKNEYCKDNKILLYRIKYTDKISDKLDEIFNIYLS